MLFHHSFLNSKDDGNIYIGVDDNVKIIGQKSKLDLFKENERFM